MNITGISPVKMGDLSGLDSLFSTINIVIWAFIVVYVIFLIRLIVNVNIQKQSPEKCKRRYTKGDLAVIALLHIPLLVMIAAPLLMSLCRNTVVHKDKELSFAYWDKHYEAPYVDSYDYSENISAQLLEAAARGDRERIRILFTKTSREREGFDEQVERFIESCPKSKVDIKGERAELIGLRRIHYDGDKIDYLNAHASYFTYEAAAYIDGERYYIYVDVCDRNNDADESGLLFFCIQDEKSNAKSHEEETDYSSQTIVCEINK